MIRDFGGVNPVIDKKAYVFEEACVVGDVEIGEYSSVWFNATVRGDVAPVKIGKYTNIQDNAVLHVADNLPCVLGDYVTVGHSAVLHACTVEEHCLIGMSATVLDGAVIGKGSIVGAGALVTKNTVIPPNSLVLGSPAKVVKTLDDKSLESIHSQAIKYKAEWTLGYKIMPDADGEQYHGGKIV
ncbi:carbonic anhydrase/acetyltransferase-like protein (isoleucine patch superfamily) [Pectinatus brassicae]|uniref:Carbonic anhydrase/acetyltransferase-like protein (Isoleucine patch superfamily) n=1 Tax=Pectinatus brassicae TaxID=862415 RepID=A0A840UIZ9_9FIRM|nr:gamma carbonic anhydrase family protein [Pectinatus brassicae]MBB5335587.1 carbonic anhydrase/acetyltransferase-like protein (isoleucine patch superfamily) [Pectinatus brassicae]